ncbi:cysteine-rich KTR domain-containing protein [Morganella morganii]
MCPVCGNKTRLKIREDTELKKFPLYCPKCRQENLIEIKQFKVTAITEPDAKTQSRLNEINTISFYRLFPLCMDSFN